MQKEAKPTYTQLEDDQRGRLSGRELFTTPWGGTLPIKWAYPKLGYPNGVVCTVSQHVPIYLQQFPSYSNRKCKKSPFTRAAAHIFVSPGDAPATITQYVARIERQFNACQTPRSSFRLIRCLSQCVSPKIAIFTTFLFPLGTPLGQSR